MTNFFKALIATVILVTASAANAAFVLSTNGGDGFITGSFPGFTLASNNAGGNNILTTYTDTIAADQSLSFDWTYLTQDVDGSGFDPAGYTLNGVLTQLSPFLPNGGTASGSVTLSLLAGDVFGWYVNSTDGALGRGFLTIDAENVSAVPLPAAAWLFGSALMGFAGFSTRRKV